MFPMVVRVIEFGVIASGVWTLTQLFPFLHVMTRGGPGYETTTLDYMIYLKSFGFSFGVNYGMACAIAVILLFMILAITSLEMIVSRRAETGRRA
jgi:multiple sugar transport system permease protein